MFEDEPKPVIWTGTSLRELKTLPEPVQHRLGHMLQQVQFGHTPPGSKAMHSIGDGVMELRVHVSGAFRLIYVAKFSEAIYVLHAFQKKSQKTALLDLQLARSRYTSVLRNRETK